MSFPPFPPSGGGRYSPSNAYTDASTYTPSTGYRPHAPYQTFDAYGSPANGTDQARAPFTPYDQPRRAYENDTYDPYQPSQPSNGNAYDPGAPHIRLPPPAPVPSMPNMPNFPPRPPQTAMTMPLPVAPPATSVPRAPMRSMDGPSHGTQHLTVLTEPTTVHLAGQDVQVHTLPPSHLPITKYIATSRNDAIEIHRRLCMGATSIWYADGSSRAGEGWSAAVEWLIDSSRSGSKMRECLGNADGLDVELGGIFKAAEGFLEALRQAIKDGKPHTQELIVFCDSQAAIVGIDTSSRLQAVKFNRLWREICSEFLQAELKLAWLPKGLDIEGHILADKIATVGASNSYLKRRKENTLADAYKRPGGGEPMPPGSTEAGPWQRGDADPSKRKSPFERPTPLPLPLPLPLPPVVPLASVPKAPPPDLGLRLNPGPLAHPIPPRPADPVEEEAGQPREGSIFVTHFPDEASAKDIGILFGQYGNIVAVDIYHIAQGLPRFAFVAYTDAGSGLAAIDDLHLRPISMSSDFARENWADLDIWRRWDGRLTVVRSESGRLVPSAVLSDFPNVPDWAVGGRKDEASPGRKRDRTPGYQSPNKRTRQGSHHRTPSFSHPPSHVNVKVEPETQATDPLPNSSAAIDHPLMSSFPSHAAASGASASPTSSSQAARSVVLPPTPITADPNSQLASGSTPTVPAAAGSNSSKRPLTNSASEPQEYPIKVGPRTIRAQIELVKRHFGKVHVSNWIAHSCFIASEIDQARRALQDDLYATDTGFLAGRELERTLADRGFTPQRVDAFITKVLKVLDGIALAEADEDANGMQAEDEAEVERELVACLEAYPDQTKEAVDSAARLMEYLMRGKEAQEKKRLEVERRVKVLEGMVKIGEVVGGVVRYLLSDEK